MGFYSGITYKAIFWFCYRYIFVPNKEGQACNP